MHTNQPKSTTFQSPHSLKTENIRGTSFKKILGVIENISDRKFTDDELSNLAHGAGEYDLVDSGLEETMITAYQQIADIRNKHGVDDLRTAAFIGAINKIGIMYEQMGIFP